MATCKFSNLITLCRKLGLTEKQAKSGIIFTGMINGNMVRICIHKHAGGRDIPTGTFRTYVKELGFKSVNDFLKALKDAA